MSPWNQITKVHVVLIALSAVLLTENVTLQLRNKTLAKSLERKDAALQVTTGQAVPQLRGLDLHKKVVSISPPADRDLLVLVASKYCGWCDENWPKWQLLLSESLPASPVLVDLSAGMQPTDLAAHHVADLPFIHEVDTSMIPAYSFRLVPQTIIVGSDRKVRGIWTGPLKQSDVDAIRAKLRSDAEPLILTK